MQTYKKIGYLSGPPLFGLLLLIAPFEDPLQNKVLAVAAWMLVWWVLETVPIYITALLPMVLFPMLGIMDVKETFIPYANPIIFLFLGGFIIALAMEHRRLHERIAYGLLRLTGTRPKGIVLGFMIATASVAMWISNTATAVMMLPIALSIMQLLEGKGHEDALVKRLSLLLMLGIAYAANIGGMVTLIGTPPNLVFAGFYFEEFGVEFEFADWLKIGIPVGVVLIGLGYLLLTKIVYPISSGKMEGVEQLLKERWTALGRMGRAESLVLVVFTITVFLWVFAVQINDVFETRVLNNTSIAMLGGILMFLIPVNWKDGEFILHWKQTSRLPWGILLLFGGGLCLAAGLEKAGIISAVATWVSELGVGSPFVLMLALTALALFLTEVMSNVALVTVLLPVVFAIAHQMEVNALLLTVPVTLAASCAFMMPISTPPNAIVYSSGHLTVRQMMKAGIWMNIISIAIIGGIAMLLFS